MPRQTNSRPNRSFRSMCPVTSVRRGRRHQVTVSRQHLQASRVPLELLALGPLARLRPLARLCLVVQLLLLVCHRRGPLRLRQHSFRHRRHPSRCHRRSTLQRWRRRLCRRWAEECPIWEADCLDSEGNSATCWAV